MGDGDHSHAGNASSQNEKRVSVARSRSIVQNGLVAVIATVVFLLIAEASLRALNVPRPLDSGWGWEESPRRPKGQAGPLYQNQLDCRGQPIDYRDDDFVVLLVGDSQVEASASPPAAMPEQFLQRYLGIYLRKNVRTYSIAASGWGQDQQLIALEAYFEMFRADLVLVWATPANDFWENAFPDRSLTAVAGHLKPTYRLAGDRIEGPFFESGTYYRNSAILQLVGAFQARRSGESLEQRILRAWLADMPAPHAESGVDMASMGRVYARIDVWKFMEEIHELDESVGYVLQTVQDFVNSRSVCSPYAVERSERDDYLVALTSKLFEQMARTSNEHGAEFFVFCDVREERTRAMELAAYVEPASANGAYPIRMDFPKMMTETVRADQLILFDLPGGAAIGLSKEDRHLNNLGNERAMMRVSDLVARRLYETTGETAESTHP